LHLAKNLPILILKENMTTCARARARACVYVRARANKKLV